MTFVTGMAFGLTPGLAVSGWPVQEFFALSHRSAVGAGGTGARRVLVISELAFAAMLLVAAGLLIRSYVQLQHVETGFEPEGVTTFSVSLPAPGMRIPQVPARSCRRCSRD